MSGSHDDTRTPVLVNRAAGSAERLLPQLRADQRLQVIALHPPQLAAALERHIGAERLLVCGGDGTLSLAASHLAGSATALAVIPGGTLNHFAARLGLPSDPIAAVNLALQGHPQAVDVGFVNERLFLNTSALGSYVTFVRQRDYLQRRMGYLLASIVAGLRRLLRWRRLHFMLAGQQLKAPLVFIGLQERDLSFPELGQPKARGERGLHVIAVTTRSPWHILRLLSNAFFRGIDPLAEENTVQHWVVPEICLDSRGKRALTIALDGELLRMRAPLLYRFSGGALRVIRAHDHSD